MALYFPSILTNQDELAKICQIQLHFNSKGYLIDNTLALQKKLEDHFGQIILSIQQTTQNQIVIITDGYGRVFTNQTTGKRTALLQGDFAYIKSLLELMIEFHPEVKPVTIISAYTFGCTPNDKFELRKWTKDTYNCV